MQRTPELVGAPKAADVLLLGGGGWRGAFGAIGSIMYLHSTGQWDDIREVVSVSGGSFVVAALASEGVDDRNPCPPLRQLMNRLLHQSRRRVNVSRLPLVAVATAEIALLAATVFARRRSFRAAAGGAALLGTFVGRLVASVCLRWAVHGAYGWARMRSDTENATTDGTMRRYVIGATGLTNGTLYGFSTTPHRDGLAWLRDRSLPVPLGRRHLTKAVVRSTSLPGLGHLGLRRLALPDGNRCPDHMVDGGLSGIFGRGLVHPSPGLDGDGRMPYLLAIDAGRYLTPEANLGLQHLSAFGMLVRWLTVSLGIRYRQEVAEAADSRTIAHGYKHSLIRLAESERVDIARVKDGCASGTESCPTRPSTLSSAPPRSVRADA